MEHGDAGVMKLPGVPSRVPGGGGHEPDALLGDEVDDAGVGDQHLGDVDTPWFGRPVAHRRHFAPDLVEAAGRRFDDPEASRVRNGGGQLRPSHKSHGSLQQRVVDTEKLGDTCTEWSRSVGTDTANISRSPRGRCYHRRASRTDR